MEWKATGSSLSRRNDGTRDTFRAGHKVDDLFFFVTPDDGKVAMLFVDEVVLFDAATNTVQR
jgi:hypothetical protein